MATIVGPQTVTIGTQELSLVKSWVPKYHNELKKGNTTIKKALMATEGEAILRASHQVSKGVEGHVISLEVQGVRGTVPTSKLVKAQLVLTCEAGDAEEATLLTDVTEALCGYVPTVMGDVMADVID